MFHKVASALRRPSRKETRKQFDTARLRRLSITYAVRFQGGALFVDAAVVEAAFPGAGASFFE